MKSVKHSLILSVLACASVPCNAREQAASAMLSPAVFGAVLWLLVLGWAFRALLRRQLRAADRISETEAQLGLERKSRALAERALADTRRSLCRLMQQQELVRETERNRIARDIHDDLGQNLLALKIELSLLQMRTGGTPALDEMIGGMLRNLDLSIKSLRAIINDLRPALLEDGLRSAIEWQLGEFARLHGIRYALEADPEAFRTSPGKEVEATLFRILQESLSNVARHAHASEVRIALGCQGGQLTLTVEDNGVGMVGEPSPRGCGLSGIRDRVSVLGGKFTVASQAGVGTRLSLAIPLTPALAAH